MKKGREKMSFVAEKNKTEMKSKKEIKLYNVKGERVMKGPREF